jgi:imidazolonepropionase-like amidohydrolase
MDINSKDVKRVKDVKETMSMRRTKLIATQCAIVLIATLAFAPIGATPVLARRSAEGAKAALYAIKGATIHTSAGPVIANGTIVMRNGVIDDIGANVTVPADAFVIDAAGLHMYPGLIDMDNAAPLEGGETQAAAGGGGGRGGGGGGGATQTFATLEEAERAKRTAILRPHYMAAENLRPGTPALQALSSAGVTSVLAVPSQGIFKGQSALVNVAIPPDDPQISTIADYRGGLAVVKSPVAQHVNMAGRGGGQGYPGALLGTIAFTKQGFLDAQWQRDAEAQYQRAGAKGPRPIIEPALDALKPALAKQMPVAFDVNEAREIDRALAMAAEYGLDPIVVGAAYAAERKAELAAAKARVILSLNLPGAGGGGAAAAGGGGGGRGGGGAPSLRMMKFQADAPKVPAVLALANVPFAFGSGGATPANFVRNAGRVIKEGGLAADAVLRALTIDAARMAGAADRLGSLEKGKIANLVVTEGDLFDGGRVRHVFIDGRPVEVVEPAAPGANTGRGRGGR